MTDDQAEEFASAIAALGEHLEFIARDVGDLRGRVDARDGHGLPERRSEPSPLVVWPCKRCGWRLGFLDQQSNTLQIRVRETVILITPGSGGVIRMICPKCGALEEAREE